MKNSFAILFLFAIQILNAQVGIGTTHPDPTALFDIVSTTSGVLIPRMDNASEIAIQNPATGLLIYNTQTNQIKTKLNKKQYSIFYLTPLTLLTIDKLTKSNNF